MPPAYVISACRTPIGKFLGGLREVPAPELAAVAIREALSRAEISPAAVNEVILGHILSGGVGQAPARQAALKAGLPDTVAAFSVNKVCGSGLQAVMLGAQAIRAGDARVVVAGGMENMSRAPHLLRGAREGLKFGAAQLDDSMLVDGLWCAFEGCHMGNHAELTAVEANLTRRDQDEFSAESQARASRAIASGAFANELVGVPVKVKGQPAVIGTDECPRPETTADTLARLKPAFDPQGTVTAGNSSLLADGAAALVVVDEATALEVKTP
ncbi:MAG: acetyl-CoA C-acyltransferase, partial [Planctomycetota bacterium]|nr:acetyl-CoA C-acyltransferase [Planctomycetota bacterium]